MNDRINGDQFRLVFPLEVRFSDLDALGHVNSVTYFTYFEIARLTYLRAVARRPVTLADILVIVDARCRYRSPALIGEILQIGVRVSHMRRCSFTFEYLIQDEVRRRPIADGHTVVTTLDRQTNRVLPVDMDFRAQVERFEVQTLNSRESIPPGRAEPASAAKLISG